MRSAMSLASANEVITLQPFATKAMADIGAALCSWRGRAVPFAGRSSLHRTQLAP
jgi:hypothetical protein